MRSVAASAEPEAASRAVSLPASFDDEAAAALAAMLPGDGPIDFVRAAEAWLPRLAPAGGADALRLLLLTRRGCPGAAIWRGEAGSSPVFVLNVAAFHDVASGFDVEAFGAAASLAAEAMRRLAPDGARRVALTGLDLLLALQGLDYAGEAARHTAACLAALAHGRIAAVSDGQLDLLAAAQSRPAAPPCPVPGLTAAATAALAGPAAGRAARLCVLPAGPEDALLGVEVGGIAPGFSPVHPDGRLTRSAQARLVALGLSAEAALALTLLGEAPLAPAEAAAYGAMREAVAPWMELDALPDTARPARRREALPERQSGISRRVTVGGHRLHLRTAEFEDGRLGEISIGLPRDGAALRGLMDSFAAVTSLALQHGVPLEELVETFAGTRYGPAGAVEGDPVVGAATSLVDYVFRALSVEYLGQVLEPPIVAAPVATLASRMPMLPLEWPDAASRRRAFRLVS